jgi:hypothetical protein
VMRALRWVKDELGEYLYLGSLFIGEIWDTESKFRPFISNGPNSEVGSGFDTVEEAKAALIEAFNQATGIEV